MSDPAPEIQPANGPSRIAPRPGRALLAACLAGVAAFLLAGCGSGGGRPPASSSADGCTGAGAGTPQALSVAPGELGSLRASVARVLPERVGHLYEEGTVSGSNFWSDDSPSGPTVSARARREGGYEMRWWAPNGDDVVADVLLFASSGQAAEFLRLAAAGRCGHALLSGAADRPPQGRNLAWLNPDGVAEADVYLQRGRRVYRVGDVPAGQRQQPLPPGPRLRRALAGVDTLACLLPGADCGSESRGVPA
jgi:hypothetical protein